MKIMLSASVARASPGLLKDAIESTSDDTYLIGEAGDSHEELKKLGRHLVTFVAPKEGAISWKANLSRALAVSLYLDSCKQSVAQARVLGVPAAHFEV